MRTIVLGSLGMIACWSGGGAKPTASPASTERELVVAEAEHVVGRSDERALARWQAVEQARAAGILGQAPLRAPPVSAPGTPLDRASIRREIHAHLQSIRWCYERRMIEDEALQGTTRVTFVIGSGGRVISSTGAGFDAAVDACVAEVVQGIRFPAPDGGGTLRVIYPFTFRPPP